MNVLHLEAGRHVYGGAAQVLMLLGGLRALPAAAADRHRLVCAAGSAVQTAAERAALDVTALPIGGDLDAALLWRLGRLIDRERPDLIHVHSRRGADLWGALAAARAGVPALLSRRVDNPDNRWQRRKYRRYRRVIAISAEIRRLLIEREGLTPQRVVCIPSAVDTDRFRPHSDAAARRRLRREFGFDDDDPVLAVAAQLIDRKGQATLLDALPAIVAAHPDARLLLLGRGAAEPALRRRAAALGVIGERVCFAGLRDDLATLLPAVDLLVHPALMEGLGVALLEAAACGVAIVASAVGGIPEIVRDGVNGRLVAPADPVALAAAVNALLADPARRADYGRRGRERVLSHFSIPRMVRDTRAVYRQVLAENDR